ncbi:uncharacterized protein LOC133833088 [Humulus lupulus]|uniref:uncharacterized protein LOC133833088 n=1 Tax=Humulus lupulus TaxID=3486 RepID=UPI002B414C5B|nr:uncharacterized protein LOC133833088 [Humulus lupulus]
MVNTRHTTFDPTNQELGNGEPLASQPFPQSPPEDTPHQMSQPDESQNYEGGAEYEEDYYEEEGNEGEYHDLEPEDPEIPEGVDPNQEDPEVSRLRQQVLDQEARIVEQKEATRRMQESLQALQAFIATQGSAANPPVVPPPGMQPPALQARNGAPEDASLIPPQGQAPEQGLGNPDREKRKTGAIPQRKNPSVQKARTCPRPLLRKEKVHPVPGQGHTINLQGTRPQGTRPRYAPGQAGWERSLHPSALVNKIRQERPRNDEHHTLSSRDDTSRVDLREGMNARKEQARK